MSYVNMGQPKKLSHAQKIQKVEDNKLEAFRIQLVRLKLGLANSKDFATWRWAGFQLLMMIESSQGSQTRLTRRASLANSEKAREFKEAALEIARDAEAAMNYLA